MTLHERQVGDVTILDVDGRIAIQDGVDILRGALRQLFALSRVKLVLNLERVPYIDSTALGEIVRAHTSAIRRKGGLTLLHVPARVRELLRITRLLPVLDLSDDESEVVQRFAAKLD